MVHFDVMAQGRQSTTRIRAREAGDYETFAALLPPSERHLRDDERCGARNKTNGNSCRQRKGANTDHPGYGYCYLHGGSTEAGIKSAMREMGRDLAERYKDSIRFGGDRNDPTIASLTPEQALLEEVRRSAAFVRYLEERIAHWNLTPVQQETIEAFAASKINRKNPSLKAEVDDIILSLEHDNPDSPAYLPPLTRVHEQTGLTSFTDAREWLYLYREERAHLARVAKMSLDAGVAQRLVTLAEDQGRILASALRAVLGALSLTPEQEQIVPRVVPAVLRAVASDQPIPDISSLLPAPVAAPSD